MKDSDMEMNPTWRYFEPPPKEKQFWEELLYWAWDPTYKRGFLKQAVEGGLRSILIQTCKWTKDSNQEELKWPQHKPVNSKSISRMDCVR
jgi:hypothetical protein